MGEIWKDIPNYEGLYQISNLGRVKSLERIVLQKNGRKRVQHELIRKPRKVYKGYLQIDLWKNHEYSAKRINRLVAQAFIPNPENKPEVNHIDGNKENNCVDNLEWVTGKENMQHAIRTGLWKASHSPKKNRKSKKIIQLDDENNVIKVWDSIRDIMKYYNLKYSSHIYACINGKRNHYKNYKWKYE